MAAPPLIGSFFGGQGISLKYCTMGNKLVVLIPCYSPGSCLFCYKYFLNNLVNLNIFNKILALSLDTFSLHIEQIGLTSSLSPFSM